MTTSPFLPPNQSATFERIDQGVDFRTRPGGVIVAPYAGVVSVARPNPGGFGTHYPLITFTEGPWKGQQWYIGHTLTLRTGKVSAGDPISRTGTGKESWIGNATGIPGHAEIGRWPPGSMSAGAAVKNLVLGRRGTAGTGQTTGLSINDVFQAPQAGEGPTLSEAVSSDASAGAKAIVSGLADAIGVDGAKILLWIVLVGGGTVLAVLGITRATGLKPPSPMAVGKVAAAVVK